MLFIIVMKFEHEVEKFHPTFFDRFLVPLQAIAFATGATEECLNKLGRLLEEFLNIVEYKKAAVIPVVLARRLNPVSTSDGKRAVDILPSHEQQKCH